MTTKPNLAATIARVEAFIDRNLNPGGAANDWLVDDLRALLACARRCEAIDAHAGTTPEDFLPGPHGSRLVPEESCRAFCDAAAVRRVLMPPCAIVPTIQPRPLHMSVEDFYRSRFD